MGGRRAIDIEIGPEGHIVLPSVILKFYGTTIVLSPATSERILDLWTLSAWKKTVGPGLLSGSPPGSKFRWHFVEMAHQLTADDEGRIRVPDSLWDWLGPDVNQSLLLELDGEDGASLYFERESDTHQ